MSKLKVDEFQNKEQLNFFLKEIPEGFEPLQIIPLFNLNNPTSDVLYVVVYKAWKDAV